MSDPFRDERMLNYWYKQMAETVLHKGPLITLLERNMPKPTRLDRFTWRVLHYRNRVRDAWLVLMGKKEACDPCEF